MGGFYQGGKDGKHYWITPPPLMDKLQAEFGFDFDACPYPLPTDFDGLTTEWGTSTYVNPPFGSIVHEGVKKGPTAWARKAIAEAQKGKRVVMVYPIDKWVLRLIDAGARILNLGDVKWTSIEDGKPGPGTGRFIALFDLDGRMLEPEVAPQSGSTPEPPTQLIERTRAIIEQANKTGEPWPIDELEQWLAFG